MRVLITGGAGFKGCVIATLLKAHGHDVTVFDRLTYGEAPALGLLRAGVKVVRGDVLDGGAVAAAVAAHDAVIHLAALVGFPLCQREPLMAEAVNVAGTANVVRALRPGQPLIYASTGSVYGRVDSLADEMTEPKPLTLYGETKLEGERLVLAAGGAALRFATVMGVSPCMRFDLLVNAFVYRAVHTGWLACYQADDRRSFLDVTDAAEAYRLALDNYSLVSGRVFNVGAPELNLSKREVIEAISQRLPMRVVYEDDRCDPDQRDYEVDFGRIEEVGFRAKVSLLESIDQVAAAARLSDGEAAWRFRP